MGNKGGNRLGVSQVKTLLLVSTKIPPRTSLFNHVLNTTVINEDYLSRVPPLWRRTFYRFVPAFLAQILETYIVRKRFDVVVSWSDQNALLF
ncbi:MAG: hypothetical protein M1339_06595, partial [Bacteroidetes bacterium]|nr:hypothetical protein [Bacteroidota bacterium]